MFYLNTIEKVFLFVEQLDQLEVCLPHSRLLTGIPILVVFQNLRLNSNKTSLLFDAIFYWSENYQEFKKSTFFLYKILRQKVLLRMN